MAEQSSAGEQLTARRRVLAWLDTPAATNLILIVILLVGAYLRLSNVNWDSETHIHPDERFLTMVADQLKLPSSIGEYLDSTRSPLNPYNVRDASGNMQFSLYVYGNLPMTIVRVVAEVANHINQSAHIWIGESGTPIDLTAYWGVHYVGRVVSGLFDLAGVWVIFLIGRRLYGRRAGLLAALLLTFAVLPLQQAHFFTADTFATFFALVTFYYAVRVVQGGRDTGARPAGLAALESGWLSFLALGVSLGATIACRINLAPLAGIALLAIGMRAWDEWRVAHQRAEATTDGSEHEAAWGRLWVQATLFRLVLFGLAALLSFRVTMPYAFGGKTLLDFSLSSHWLDNMHEVSQLVSGAVDYPPGHQWTGRTPFVFLFVNMVVWGLGLPLGIAGWAGFVLAAWQVLRSLTRPAYRPEARRHLLVVAWVGGMFFWQGMQYVQSMRYILPIYPFVCLLAAWLGWWVVETGTSKLEAGSWKLEAGEVQGGGASVDLDLAATDYGSASDAARPAPGFEQPASRSEQPASGFKHRASSIELPASRLGYALLSVVTIGTMLWGWGFLAIYRRPLTRVTASRWIYANVPAGSHIANENWDDGLPLSIDGRCAFKPCGPYQGLSSSSSGQMNMYDEDTPEKRELLYRWLDEADFIVLSSNRLYGSIPRLPLRYPMTTLYYQLLFQGKLGFQQVLHVTSFPTIFGIQFNDTGAEEAFSVYDHPVVYIFKKTSDYSEAKVRQYFGSIDLENTVQYWPRQASKAPTALLMTNQEASRQQAGGTWSTIFSESSLVNRLPVVFWLVLIELLGLISFPITFVALRRLNDRGYAFAKTFGILALAWLSWFGPALKVLPYTRWLIALALVALAAAGAALAWRRRAALAEYWRSHRALLLTEEVLFLALFGLFLLIRWGNPDLWHPARGGEKPMDLAFLNAVIRSTTFPPYDPWFAGGFMNYYYFGFVMIGTLVKLTGILPWVAYNLAVPTLFALTGLGAFGVAYNLAAGDREIREAGITSVPSARHAERVGHVKPVATSLQRSISAPSSAQRPFADDASSRMSRGQPAQGDTEPVTTFGGAGREVEGNTGLGATEGDAGGPQGEATATARGPEPLPLFAGLAATFFVAIIGNLGEIKLIFDQWASHSPVNFQSTIPGFAWLVRLIGGALAWITQTGAGRQAFQIPNDWWFWNASRVIPDTINEFPFFTFVYADLHAHMMAFPLALLGLGAAVALVRADFWRGRRDSEAEPSPWLVRLGELWPMLLLGFVIGALRATNTWDFPTYVLVALAALVVLEVARRTPAWRLNWNAWKGNTAQATSHRTPGSDPVPQNGPASPYAGGAEWPKPGAGSAEQPAMAQLAASGAAEAGLAGRIANEAQATALGGYGDVPPVGNGLATGYAQEQVATLTSTSPLLAQLGFLFRSVVAVIWRLLIILGVATVAFYPFTRSYATAYSGLQTWHDGTTSLSNYLVVHGFFLALITIYLASELVVQLRTRAIPKWLDAAMPFVLGVFILVLAAGVVFDARVWLIALPLFVMALVLACGRDLPPTRRLALLLLALGLAITMGVEVVRLQDDIGRMNTVFKFYLQAWILFGAGTAFGLASWVERSLDWPAGWRRLATILIVVLFAGALLYSPLAARAKVADRFSAEDQPRGLDGMAYMDQASYFDQGQNLNLPADKEAILWMLNNVKGSPVILEGNTPNYRWGGRFSIYTGLPSVMGWDWHEKQQRSVVPVAMIDRRVNHVHELYTSTDLARTRDLLDLYHVSYIVVGELERAFYGPLAQTKFDTLVSQGYLRVAYDKDGVRIYEVANRS